MNMPETDRGTMKAIVYDRYGSPDVLELREIAKPIVKDNEVLVRVHAASVQPLDWHFLRALPHLVRLQAGFRKPKKNIPGVDLAGTVEAVGKDVTRFHVGDEVFGEKSKACAEFVSCPEDLLVLKPSNSSFEQAAGIPVAAFTALQALRDKANVGEGQKVLINGASGGVGTFAVQIAKALGAEVTGVCSTRNVEIVRSIGADHIIDYSKEDFTQLGEKYDVIFDLVGRHSLSAFKKAMEPDGVYVSAGAPVGDWIGPVWWLLKVKLSSMFGSRRMVSLLARQSTDDLLELKDLVEAGKVTTVVDKTFSLAETAAAIRYVEDGHTQGKVIISVQADAL